jgi:hypothetical protein
MNEVVNVQNVFLFSVQQINPRYIRPEAALRICFIRPDFFILLPNFLHLLLSYQSEIYSQCIPGSGLVTKEKIKCVIVLAFVAF